MGSQTTHGFPYPVGTDRVMDGDNAMQALAQFTDDTLWAGGKFPRSRIDIQSAGASIPHNVTTIVGLVPASIAYDNNAMIDLANSKITIKTAGFYVFTTRFVWSNNATGFRAALLYKNGTPCVDAYSMAINGTVSVTVLNSDPTPCAVNDVVQLRAFQTSGAALSGGITANSFPSFITAWFLAGQ